MSLVGPPGFNVRFLILTYETEFVLFLAALKNSLTHVLPMG